MKTYTGVLSRIHAKQPRKIIVAYGSRFEFVDGRLSGIPEYAATMLLKRKILQAIIPDFDESAHIVNDFTHVTDAVEEHFNDVTTTEEKPVPVENVYDEQPVEVPVEETAPELVSVVENQEQKEEDSFTKEELETLYNNLGTWTAVASSLGISTTTLKRYRELVGL